MCEQCDKIDADMAYYERMLARTEDQTAIVLLKLLIEDLASAKAALHPQDEKP
jgi:hypothetical protein